MTELLLLQALRLEPERSRGQGTRGINGRGPRSGRATVYAAKALDAGAAVTLSGEGWGNSLHHPLPRGERGVRGGAPSIGLAEFREVQIA